MVARQAANQLRYAKPRWRERFFNSKRQECRPGYLHVLTYRDEAGCEIFVGSNIPLSRDTDGIGLKSKRDAGY